MAPLGDVALSDAIRVVLHAGIDTPLDDDAFNRLALDTFRFQFERSDVLARYWQRRGATPGAVDHWTGIPPVPTEAFRAVDLATSPAEQADAVFRTSGTSRGEERRGRHVVPDLALYDASLLAGLGAFVFPDLAGGRMRVLALVARPDRAPDSSLAHMVGRAVHVFGDDDSGWFVDPAHGLDGAGLRGALAGAVGGDPVALLGTTLAFVGLLDGLEASGERYRLPHGSRIMDTGGFKGVTRTVEPAELGERYARTLGVPATHQVNEYGMTELCSQFYGGALRARSAAEAADGPSVKQGPPWVRVRAVRPDTLEPVAEGETGILQFFDLANAGSVLAVQTEDRGRLLTPTSRQATGAEFELLGRSPGATPRGCSIAMDMLLGREGRGPA